MSENLDESILGPIDGSLSEREQQDRKLLEDALRKWFEAEDRVPYAEYDLGEPVGAEIVDFGDWSEDGRQTAATNPYDSIGMVAVEEVEEVPPAPTKFIAYEIDGAPKKMYGGSFFDAPQTDDFFTIDLMAERPLPCDYYFPIQDYSCPTDLNKMTKLFDHIKTLDKDVYVGCWGGLGRTGLFMACFLKYVGYDDALKIVRTDYNSHAVETPEQEEFLKNFPTFVKPTPSKPSFR